MISRAEAKSISNSIDALSAEQQQQVAEILDAYLIAQEEGRAPSIDSLVAEHPELESVLREYLDGLQLLRVANNEELRNSSDRSSPGSSFANSVRLQDYDLHQELGRGAMGIVYAATQKSLGRRVAIKVLTFGSILDSHRVERFQREARVAASLNHPGIVSVDAIGFDQGIHFYVMPRIDGLSLDRLIQSLRTPTADESEATQLSRSLSGSKRFKQIARIGAGVADALQIAHEAGIVHRDIKPSNLLLGKDGQIRVTDFGLARMQGTEGLTRSGDLVGTFRYMSPEQARGRVDLVDGRTDIYGLGATLYELVTLQPPFPGDDGPALLRAIVEREPPAPRTVMSSIPIDLNTIIQRAMRPERSDRYSSAAELADDMRRFIDGKPILAARVTTADRLASWARMHVVTVLAAVATLAVALLGTLAAVALIAQLYRQANDSRELAEKNYHQARRAVDSLGAKFAARLEQIPEAESVRRDMLAETLGYYEQFIASANRDPKLAADVAKTRWSIARVVRMVGSFDDANRTYSEAVESLRKIAMQTRRSEDITAEYFARNEWAMLLSDDGKQSDALSVLNSIDTSSVDHGNSEQLPSSIIAMTANNRGVILLRSGKLEEAILEAEKAITALEADKRDDSIPTTSLAASPTVLIASDTQQETSPTQEEHRADGTDEVVSNSDRSIVSNPDVLPDRLEILPELAGQLADSMNNLSVMLDKAGASQRAAELSKESLRLRLAYEKSKVPSADRAIRMSIAYSNLGALQWRAKAVDEAIEDYRLAIRMLEEASKFPNPPSSINNDLAITLNNLGMAASAKGDFFTAEAAFRRALTLSRVDNAANPRNAEALNRYAGIQNNLGVLLRNRQRLNEALQCFQDAKGFQQSAINLAPDMPSYRESLRQILSNLESMTGSVAPKS